MFGLVWFGFVCKTFLFSGKTEMLGFTGLLSAEKQTQKRNEQGRLLGSAHCVCGMDSLRGIPSETGFGGAVKDSRVWGLSQLHGTGTVGSWRLRPKAGLN